MCRFLDLKRPSMITLHNIHKSFGQLEVLKGIDLEIHPREMVSIVGSSGAGKTTLLQIMGTLYKPDQGSVEIAGNDVLRLSPAKLARFRYDHLGYGGGYLETVGILDQDDVLALETGYHASACLAEETYFITYFHSYSMGYGINNELSP